MAEKEGVKEEKAKEERGPKSPAVSIGVATQLLRQVREGVGFGKAGRETVARALGYNSLNGRSNRVLAALAHYGLIDRSGDAAVQISALGKQVLLPRDDVEARAAIAVAASRPALFKKLVARFQGHGLPNLLPNILVREFGVSPGSSEEIAKVFRESMTDAGLLRNGALFEAIEDSEESPSIGQVETVDATDRGGAVPETREPLVHAMGRATDEAPAVRRYTVPLDLDGRRVAVIEIPVPSAKSDWRRVKSWIEFTLSGDDVSA